MPDRAYLYLSKVNNGETIPLTFKIETQTSPFGSYDDRSNSIDSISVNYDGGINKYPDVFSQFTFILKPIYSIIGPIIIVLAIIFTFYLYNKYKQKDTFPLNKNTLNLINNLKTLLLKVHTDFTNNINSLNIYDFKFWIDTNNEFKKRLFDNYENFNIVNKLFIFLKNRDYECLKDNIDNIKIIDYNRKCLDFTQQALAQIDWKKLIFHHADLYPTSSLIFRFSIYSLVISVIEILLYSIYPIVANAMFDFFYRTFDRFEFEYFLLLIPFVFLIITFIIRTIVYAYSLRTIVKQIRKYTFDQDLKSLFYNLDLNKKIIVLRSLFIVGLPLSFLSLLFINILQFTINFINSSNGDIIDFVYSIIVPIAVLFIDILRINIVNFSLLKKKILVI